MKARMKKRVQGVTSQEVTKRSDGSKTSSPKQKIRLMPDMAMG